MKIKYNRVFVLLVIVLSFLIVGCTPKNRIIEKISSTVELPQSAMNNTSVLDTTPTQEASRETFSPAKENSDRTSPLTEEIVNETIPNESVEVESSTVEHATEESLSEPPAVSIPQTAETFATEASIPDDILSDAELPPV